ncbi:MAG: GNAT family N-acetyltransferase [Duncaniella sp.]|nr:GNAT family N-acetyltransferase [Duncaniella sp.]
MTDSSFILDEKCQLARVTQEVLDFCQPFSCGDEDLDDFFANNAIAYERELMGKTYCWVLREDITKIVGMITLANAGIQTTHLQNHPRRKLNSHIPYSKQGRTYPSVLIGRLGVSVDFQGSQYRAGAQIMDFIKDWFKSYDNKTGCRFILVDAVNDAHAIAYYERNGFRPLFPRVEDERAFYHIPEAANLRTRMYYFDLL